VEVVEEFFSGAWQQCFSHNKKPPLTPKGGEGFNASLPKTLASYIFSSPSLISSTTACERPLTFNFSITLEM